MLSEFLSLNIYTYFLVFARVGSALSIMPGFSSRWVPMPMRLAMAILICFVITPPLARFLPPLASTPAELVLVILGEMVIGFYFGVIGIILIGTLQSAGTFISLFSSLANALVRDPIADQQSSLVSGFLSLLGLIMVFVTDTHHLMLRALTDSYGLFEPGKMLVSGDAIYLIARKVGDSFNLALRMAAPLMLTSLTYYLGLGILGRLMPMLPVFFIGLPLQLLMQIVTLMLVLPAIMMVFITYFQNGFVMFMAP
ncbi:MAG: flagellar biosynthetic protein FliR [Rhodospirillales bacterium]